MGYLLNGGQRNKLSRYREAAFKRQGGLCYWCYQPMVRALSDRTGQLRTDGNPLTLTADHLVQHAHGGKITPENIVAACRRCNNSRHQPGWKPPMRRVLCLKQSSSAPQPILPPPSIAKAKGYSYELPKSVFSAKFGEFLSSASLDELRSLSSKVTSATSTSAKSTPEPCSERRFNHLSSMIIISGGDHAKVDSSRRTPPVGEDLPPSPMSICVEEFARYRYGDSQVEGRRLPSMPRLPVYYESQSASGKG